MHGTGTAASAAADASTLTAPPLSRCEHLTTASPFAKQGAAIATKTLESIASQLPEDTAACIRRQILLSELGPPSPPPEDGQTAASPKRTAAATPNVKAAMTWETLEPAHAHATASAQELSAAERLLPTAIPSPAAAHRPGAVDGTPAASSSAGAGSASNQRNPWTSAPSSSLLPYLSQFLPESLRRYRHLLIRRRSEALVALAALAIPIILWWSRRSTRVRRWLRGALSVLQGAGGAEGALGKLWGPVLVVVAFLVCFIAAL